MSEIKVQKVTDEGKQPALDPQSVSASLHNGLLKIVAIKADKPALVLPIISAAA